jgi:serine/threonine-protein kinase RsbW
MSKFTFPSDLKSVKKAWAEVSNDIGDMNINESTLFDIRLSLEEAIINAVKHGNKHDADLPIEVELNKKNDRVEIIVRDQGEGFDIEQCEDPTEEENLNKYSGRGVLIIKSLMDEVNYVKDDRCLHMIKKIKK